MFTFLFTDVERSTELWQEYPHRMAEILSRHDALLNSAVERSGGRIVKNTGDGVFAVFEGGAPLACAIEIQRLCAEQNWGEIGELRVRIALHQGEASRREQDYFGLEVTRTARLINACWGGQILLTAALANATLPNKAILLDLGTHILKDLHEPLHIYQLDHPSLSRREWPPLRTLSARPNNLPPQSTPFIGREEELAEIVELIGKPTCRLLTLVGIGGIGKTRLGLQAAAAQLETFQDGVYFVPLAPLTTSDFIIPAIAESASFSFYGREEPKKQLLSYMREKRMLLLLDNMEHLLAGSKLIGEILARAPRVKILVTSRQRLGLPGEHVIELRGLTFPKGEPATAGLESYSAVQLFLQIARSGVVDLQLNERDLPYMARICQLIEGMPLGIELAAAWTRTFTCQQIAEAIGRNLDFLAQSPGTKSERRHSVRAVFGYLWDLFSPDERRVARQLAVFRGGFQAEAAQSIAGASLFFLSALVDRAFLSRSANGRFALHELLRQYAEEKLGESSSESSETNDRHASFYAAWMEQHNLVLKSQDERAALEEIDAEIQNVREAWQWATNHARGAEIGQCLESLARFYEVRGLYQQSENALRRAIGALETTAQFPEVRARCQTALAKLLWLKGAFNEMLPPLQAAQETWTQLGDTRGLTHTLAEIGDAYLELGDYPRALEIYPRALDMARQIGDRHLYGDVIGHLGILYEDTLDYPRALECLEECVQIEREYGDRHELLRALGNIGFIYLEQNRLERAFERLYECFEVAHEVGDRYFMGKAAREMGRTYSRRGEHERALAGYAYQLQSALEIDNPRDLAVVLGYIANTLYAVGDPVRAAQVSALAIRQERKLNLTYFLCESLYYAALMQVEQGHWNAAEQLNQDAVELAARPGGRKDIALRARLLDIRLQLASHIGNAATLIRKGEELLTVARDDAERALIEHELWLLEPTNDQRRRRAAALYASLYEQTPTADYKRRYQELTGERLPDPAHLPLLPEAVTDAVTDLNALLTRAEATPSST
ncbi:MAG: tetratricopeptide repeat protein [Anaerolineae bacterium]